MASAENLRVFLIFFSASDPLHHRLRPPAVSAYPTPSLSPSPRSRTTTLSSSSTSPPESPWPQIRQKQPCSLGVAPRDSSPPSPSADRSLATSRAYTTGRCSQDMSLRWCSTALQLWTYWRRKTMISRRLVAGRRCVGMCLRCGRRGILPLWIIRRPRRTANAPAR